MSRVARFFIRCYQFFLSPMWGQHCRFEPSCSTYALQALEKFGLIRGGWLALCRIARCHPWNSGGYDPIP